MDVLDLVRDPAACDELLSRLNEIARDVNSYEFGLPMYDDGAKALMREAIYQWAAATQPAASEGQG